MRRYEGMRVATRIVTLVWLITGSAFGLTNITVTSSPYNAKSDDGLNDSAAFTSALNAIADARKSQKVVKVKLDEL